MKLIPLSAVPSQNLIVNLGGQSCQINVYVMSYASPRLYLDLSSNGANVMTGVMCHDRDKLVRRAYLGFAGDLTFVDTQGTDDPMYTGLGSRFLLIYLEASDL